MHCCYLQPWHCLLGNQNLVLSCESFTFFYWPLLSHSPVPSTFQIVNINAIIQHLSFTLKPIIATIWEQIAWFLSFECWILLHNEGVPFLYLLIHLTVDTGTSVSRLLWSKALSSLSSRPMRGMAAFTQYPDLCQHQQSSGFDFPYTFSRTLFSVSFPIAILWVWCGASLWFSLHLYVLNNCW